YLPLGAQSTFWALGYALFVGLVVLCAVPILRRRAPGKPPKEPVEYPDAPPFTGGGRVAELGGDPSPKDRLFWILCAFVPSSLLLAVTHYLTTEVAAIPLLWVLPLAVYLVTYIVAFARRAHVPSPVASRWMAVAAVALVLIFLAGVREPAWAMLLLHLGGLGAAGLLCHGRLAESRPSATHLTEFYLLVALGGVLGGAFNALAAPVLFDDVLEYPIVLVVACLLMVPSEGDDGGRRLMDFVWPLVLGLFLLVVRVAMEGVNGVSGFGDGASALLAAAVPALALYFFSNRRLRFALGVAVALLFAYGMPIQRGELEMAERTFFGVSRIVHDEEGGFRILFHGTTVHGVQSTDPARAGEPLGYYHPERPGGRVIRRMAERPGGRDVAFVGLGTGALAVLAGADDHLTFYEIDPAVVRIARDPEYFTYLERSPADREVVVGDGRIQLEEADREFDVIVLDAFSSASVPVHLLTREAVEVYLDRLAPGGVLLFHISSQHLELAPVLGAVAADLGLAAAEAVPYEDEGDLERGVLPSQWVLMARETADFLPYVDGRWRPLEAGPDSRVWTDDFADVLSVYRWN
ncbi:MAG: spermidine synthase, partial [Gemmatimonadota bacterium]